MNEIWEGTVWFFWLSRFNSGFYRAPSPQRIIDFIFLRKRWIPAEHTHYTIFCLFIWNVNKVPVKVAIQVEQKSRVSFVSGSCTSLQRIPKCCFLPLCCEFCPHGLALTLTRAWLEGLISSSSGDVPWTFLDFVNMHFYHHVHACTCFSLCH